MIDKREPTDLSQLPYEDLVHRINELQLAARFQMDTEAELQTQINPLEQQLSKLRHEQHQARSLQREAEKEAGALKIQLFQREITREKTHALHTLTQRLNHDAKALQNSTSPIEQGLARVTAALTQDQQLKADLPNLIDTESLSQGHTRRIKLSTPGDGVFIRLDVNNADTAYIVGYHVKPNTPAEIRSEISAFHQAARSPDMVGTSLRVNPSCIGVGVKISEDGSPSVTPLVLVQARENTRGEWRAVPRAEHFLGSFEKIIAPILQTGTISIPKRSSSR